MHNAEQDKSSAPIHAFLEFLFASILHNPHEYHRNNGQQRERERGMNPTAMTITNLWEEIARATRDRASDPCSQVLHATMAW